MPNRVLLIDMHARQEGAVLEILGGIGIQKRLKAIGIRPGVNIVRISEASKRGPVIVQVAGTQIALGFGMSNKITIGVKP